MSLLKPIGVDCNGEEYAPDPGGGEYYRINEVDAILTRQQEMLKKASRIMQGAFINPDRDSDRLKWLEEYARQL